MTSARDLVPKAVDRPVRQTVAAYGQATQTLRSLPVFMVIGGQRCGTTSLFKNLAEHPQVLRPATEKGTDYFSLHYVKPLEWYRGFFPIRGLANLRTLGHGQPMVFEACTYYMFHPFAMARIAKDLPNVKLIAMLRDPVERAFSAYKHEFARGYETEPDFLTALHLEPERLDGEIDKMRADVSYESIAHRHHAYRARGQYAEQLSRVFELFPRDQVIVCDSEAYFDRPEDEYRRITDFLGLEAYLPRRFDQFNSRPSRPMPNEARDLLTAHYVAHDEALSELLGRDLGWRRAT